MKFLVLPKTFKPVGIGQIGQGGGFVRIYLKNILNLKKIHRRPKLHEQYF